MKAYAHLLKSCVIAVLLLPGFSVEAFPTITNIVETGGVNEATDTVTAKWTGVTFVNGVAGEPIPGKGANDPYTVGVFGNWAPAYVDRNHRWTNASATVLLPPYLVGQEYIMIGNDNRDRTALRLDVSVATAVHVYLLIDNRLNEGNGANPPTFSVTNMQWVLDEGWVPMTNGINRTANTNWPDEIGIDEGADTTINNFSSVYYKAFPAGTFQLKQADNAGRNMYGVVVATAAPPVQPSNLTAISGDGKVTLSWNGGGATGYIVKRSLSPGGPYDVLVTNATTTYIDLEVINDTTYYYVVSAFNVAGETANSNEAVGTPKAAPTGVTAVGGVGQVQVSWNAFPNAASYTVARSSVAGGPYTVVATGVVGTSHTDTTVAGGQNYYYVVTAQLTGGGDSGQSSEASALTAPSAPTITVSLWAATANRIGWSIGNQIVTGISVEQSLDGVSFTPVGTAGATPAFYVDAGLLASTTYYYRVQAENASGMSGYSNIASNTTPAFGLNVDFANALTGTPANNPAPIGAGYYADIGEVYGPRTNGLTYGWDRDIQVDSRWRLNTPTPDIRWSTFNHLQKAIPAAIWQLDIPNGFYSVYFVAGDPDNVDSIFEFDVEGFITPRYTPAAGRNFGEFRVEVPVDDGRLTLTVSPALRNVIANNGKINFIDIYPAIPVPPSITAQPQNVTTEEFHGVTLSVGSAGSFRLVHQWYLNGNPVPDGTNAILHIPYPRMTDAGQYTVIITNYGGTVTSAAATLTVVPDATAPTITGVTSLDGRSISVCFSEELDNSSLQIEDYFNYYINGGAILATNVILRPDKRSVILQLESSLSGDFTVEVNTQVNTHRDLAQNLLPATTLPRTVVGYFAGDVGGPTHMGHHFACDPSTIEIVGGGADVWNASDQFYLVSRAVNGDFDAKVRVTSLAGSNAITKAVLVARENNDANARAYHISVNPTPPGRDQLELGLRSTLGNTTAGWGGTFTPAGIPNAWMRITRLANTFTGYRSTNGLDWIPMGTNTLALPANMAVGIGVTAHDNSLLATGSFSNFQITVKPTIAGLTYSGSQFGLSFLSDVGVNYRVEYSDSLSPPSWNTLTTVAGDGTLKAVVDPNANVARRFYRLRID